MIAGVVLAAGRSKRFGARKLLHPLDGRPLVCHAVAVAAGLFADIIVVVGNEETGAAVTDLFPDATIVTNPAPERGQLSSLKCALERLRGQCDAAMVFLGDMPYLSPGIVATLAERFETTQRLVVPVCEDEWRHPRVIPADYFEEFLALPDDARGTQVFERHSDDLELVEFSSPALFGDIDTPADLDNDS